MLLRPRGTMPSAGRRIGAESALTRDVNDQPWQADALGGLLYRALGGLVCRALGPLVHVNGPPYAAEWLFPLALAQAAVRER